MISTEIYIEDQKLDLVQDLTTEFTYTIDDIADFGQKNTSYSKTINISGTANNNKIFGFVFNLNNANVTQNSLPNVLSNFNASKVAQCRIFIDKIQIFKGVIRLMEIVQDGESIDYQCSVYGDLGGFMSELGNGKLEDLDFSTYNQIWNATNIQNSWNTIAGSGIYYPLIDFGQVSTNKIDFQYSAFRPALYVKEYLEKILEGTSYTWDFPMLTSALMQRLVIPNNTKEFTSLQSLQLYLTAKSATYTSEIFWRWNAVTLGNFLSGDPDGKSWYYNGSTAITTNIKVSLSGQVISQTFPSTYQFSLNKNGVTIGSVSITTTSSLPYSFSGKSIVVNNVVINPSDTFTVQYPTDITSLRQVQGYIQIDTTTPVPTLLNYGDTIQVNNILPRGIFQRDFFLSICKMFNLYVYDDPFEEKKLIIKPYIDFYSGVKLDWSNKIDRSKPFSIKPMSELNARYYQFKYKPDNDYYAENYRKKFTEGYGDRIFDTEFDFVDQTKTTEVIFAASVLYRLTGTDKIYPAIYKKSNNNTQEDTMDSVLRILQAQKITGATTWLLKNNTTTLATLTSYGYGGHLYFSGGIPVNDINFGAPKELYVTLTTYPTTNLFNAYYSDYMAEITDKDSKLLTCNALLNSVDITQLDFSKLIWIDGVSFRLNKVDAFNPMEYTTTKVELLKAINEVF